MSTDDRTRDPGAEASRPPSSPTGPMQGLEQADERSARIKRWVYWVIALAVIVVLVVVNLWTATVGTDPAAPDREEQREAQ